MFKTLFGKSSAFYKIGDFASDETGFGFAIKVSLSIFNRHLMTALSGSYAAYVNHLALFFLLVHGNDNISFLPAEYVKLLS